MLKVIRVGLLLSACGALTCGAQVAAPLVSIDDVRGECVEIDDYPVAIESGECRVVDFGLITAVEGLAFFYARYLITAEVPSWPNARDLPVDANALVLFDGRSDGDYVSVYRIYHDDPKAFARFSFPVPVVLETPRGKVLHIERRDTGGGMQQWLNDEYWLWQSNDWQRLDVTSWYADIDSYVPQGYMVDGVSPAHFDLVNLRNVSPVRTIDDPQCCPSAGIVTVSFEWSDLALAIREVEYDPDTDFRSVTE